MTSSFGSLKASLGFGVELNLVFIGCSPDATPGMNKKRASLLNLVSLCSLSFVGDHRFINPFKSRPIEMAEKKIPNPM